MTSLRHFSFLSNSKTESIMKLPYFRRACNEDAKMDDVGCLNSQLTALCYITPPCEEAEAEATTKLSAQIEVLTKSFHALNWSTHTSCAHFLL